MTFRPLVPETSASANSATSAAPPSPTFGLRQPWSKASNRGYSSGAGCQGNRKARRHGGRNGLIGGVAVTDEPIAS